MEEETDYDEIKMQNETTQQTPDSKGLLSEKEAEIKRRYRQMLALCFGTFCIILVLGIIRVTVNQTMIENLMVGNQKLENQYQKLEKEKKTLKEQIENMAKTQNELNVSGAQWSIDEYCRKDNQRKCEPCQKGWIFFQSSCYAYNDAEERNRRSWDEAQDDCRGKVSQLTVVANEAEKNYVNTMSHNHKGIEGCWIGLRAENRTWKWIDGTELTNHWIKQDAVDGQCVTSLENREWRSESCDQKNAWICEKKALSVE
ncbi:asialoglycoprotein receptor 1-like isoform 2-T2 [Anableps anableps]